MAILVSETFDGYAGAVVGNNISAANTIFQGITTGSIKYYGGIEGNFSSRNTSTTTGFMRESGFSASKYVFRWVWQYDSVPSAQTNFVRLEQTDGTLIGGLWMNTAGTVAMKDGNIAVDTSVALSVNTTYAFEWMIDLPTDTQTLRIYNNTATTGVTPLDTLTGEVTTSNLSVNGGVTTINWIQLGRMTSGTGFVQLYDSYQRADDWIATSSTGAGPDLWIAQFNGTPGNSVQVGDDADFDQISASAPTYVADGIDQTQQCLSIAGTVGTERYVRITISDVPVPSAWYERFYFKIQTPPSTGNEFTFWEMSSSDRSVVNSWMTIKPGTVPNTYVATLKGTYYDADLLQNVTGEIASFNAPYQSWMRVEIDALLNADGDTDMEVKFFIGNNRHGTIPSAQATVTTDGQNVRSHVLLKSAGAGTAPEFRFDSWRCDTNGQFGPTTDPFEPQLPAQYRFWEWNGTDEVLLSPRYYDGTTEQTVAASFDIAATKIQGDSTNNPSGRFPGDPGVGKIYLGWNTTGGGAAGWDTHYRETARLRGVSSPGYPANSNLKEGVYRVFHSGSLYPNLYGNNSDGTWTEGRQGAANTGFVHYTWTMDPYLDNVLTGSAASYDNWIANLAGGIRDVYERYGAYTAINCSNEPDGATISNSPLNLTKLRRCARKVWFSLVEAGVGDYCTMTTPTTINDTARVHQTAYNNDPTPRTTNTSWPNGKSDSIEYYNPDWKGTRTNWASAWDPNPADFYSGNEMDEWGYGQGPILKLFAHNSYCYHSTERGGTQLPAIWRTWTLAEYRSHLYSSSQHGGNYGRFLRALYGGNGLPILLGEWGYSLWEKEGILPYVDETVEMWAVRHVNDLVASNVIGLSLWKQPSDSEAQNPIQASICFGMGFRYSDGPTRYESDQDDPRYLTEGTNCRRKAFAAMWSRSEVVQPTSANMPMNPQHN